MIKAGESGGSLDTILLRMADTLEKQLELRGKIKSAILGYPIAVGGIVVVIVAAMLLFIVPMFEGMYADLGGTLPLPTQLLIKMSTLLTKAWWALGLLGVGGSIALKRWWKATPGRAVWSTTG